MRARAVIGALYGDEGKGLMVDRFAHEAMRDYGTCTVIRSNGGAQAAHTVETPEGIRHVFHHIGSGTLVGARTHLSQFMICNPIEFNREFDALVELGFAPEVSVSPLCPVTFPQDMLLNQMLETLRGGGRHGSCGIGIGETMERFENPIYRSRHRFGDFARMGGHLPSIRSGLASDVKTRLSALNLTFEELPSQYRDFLHSNAIWSNYWDEVQKMRSRVTVVNDSAISAESPIVFEAAQGLALDRDMGFFPYVTRSKTGLANIASLVREMSITQLEVVNLTRTYTSRHGAGPLDGERYMGDLGFTIHDPTNQPNDWQGRLRFAPLDLWLAQRMVSLDFDFAAPRLKGVDVRRSIGLTCMDQAPPAVMIFDTHREYRSVRRDELAEHVADRLGAQNAYVSHGPTRATTSMAFGEETG